MLSRFAWLPITERSLQTCRTLGYGALATPLLWALHTPSPLFALAVTAFVFPAARHVVESHLERHGDKLPTEATYRARRGERREFATHPVGARERKEGLSFEDAVTDAAWCSNEYGRRVSVICVRIPMLPKGLNGAVLERLRANVRSKDEIEAVSGDEVLVCCHLLRDASAADAIANRLVNALRSDDLVPGHLDVHLGSAISPMHGYSGYDLINHARTAARPIDRSSPKDA